MSNRRTEDEFAYFNLLKFTGAICIAIFLHYNDHFLPCLGIENPFANHAFPITAMYSQKCISLFRVFCIPMHIWKES